MHAYTRESEKRVRSKRQGGKEKRPEEKEKNNDRERSRNRKEVTESGNEYMS